MLSSLLAASEGVINVVINVRTFMITSITVRKSVDGKTVALIPDISKI